MSQTNTSSTLEGMLKKVYAKKPITDALPEFSVLQKLVPFQSAQRNGDSYNVPILVSDEHGFSYGLAGTTVTLNTEIAATTKEISVTGSQVIGAASISYDLASRSVDSEAAFLDGAHAVIMNLMSSHSKKLEACLLYGKCGIGTVSSLSTQDIILTAASWSDGCMMNLIGAKIDVYNGSSLRQGDLTVTAVDPATYTITVTGTTTGIVANDVLYYDGSYGNEMAGLDYIATNTGSLFGVSAASYPAWKAQSLSCSSSTLTQAKLMTGSALASARGGLQEEAVLLVHASSFNDLVSAQSNLVVQDPSKSKAQNGFDELVFRGVSGRIIVKCHNGVKRGEAFLFSPKNLKRVGACDITNERPGSDGKILFDSQTLSAWVIRSYSNQAIFAERPAQIVKFTNIVPST